MKKVLCGILILSMAMSCAACSNNEKTNNTSSSVTNTVASTSSSEVDNTVYKDDATYSYFRVFVNDSLKEKPIQAIYDKYGEDVEHSTEYLELLKTSFPIRAYYHVDEAGKPITGDLIIADNTTDLLHNLNEFETNDDFTEATFTSEASVRLTVAIRVNEDGEIVLPVDSDNMVAIEFEN